MDDCMLSKPGGDGGGYTLANVTETFHRIPFQVCNNLHSAISENHLDKAS